MVDEELHSYIVSKDSTANIHRCIHLVTTDEWMNDAMFHCPAIRAKQVKCPRSDTLVADDRQRMPDDNLQRRINELVSEKWNRTIKGARVEREMPLVRQSLKEDLEFIS